MSGALLVRALVDPASTAALKSTEWTALLTAARAEQLIGSLAFRLQDQPLSPRVALILDDAREATGQGQIRALWEAKMASQALSSLGIEPILLKGTAFAAAGLAAGIGRSIGDLDILVPRTSIDEVEQALLSARWEWVKDDPYDNHYYRTWMHELPPLIHRERDRMIDVHHTILPPTAKPKPDAAALIADSVVIESGARILCPTDMIVHAAAHLFADGDLAGGLRNLWDIDRLLRQFMNKDNRFWEDLAVRSERHKLAQAVTRALRLSHRLFDTPVPAWLRGRARWSDSFYLRRLLARDGWGRPARKLTRFLFYLRSHWIRMPPLLLARHLFKKARKTG